jgi:hypothetical protein
MAEEEYTQDEPQTTPIGGDRLSVVQSLLSAWKNNPNISDWVKSKETQLIQNFLGKEQLPEKNEQSQNSMYVSILDHAAGNGLIDTEFWTQERAKLYAPDRYDPNAGTPEPEQQPEILQTQEETHADNSAGTAAKSLIKGFMLDWLDGLGRDGQEQDRTR